VDLFKFHGLPSAIPSWHLTYHNLALMYCRSSPASGAPWKAALERTAPVGDAVQDAHPGGEGLRVILVQLVAARVNDGALRQADLHQVHHELLAAVQKSNTQSLAVLLL